jgi:hypothetical protein|tara:strand:+ start:85 stop:324 length:240 start_codon:yes stop_codon:yes gene_type:complete
MALTAATTLERTNLEAHVDLCAVRYTQLDNRLVKVEEKLDIIAVDMKNSNSALIKVIIGAAGSIVAGLLSTVVVVLMQF